MSNLTFCPDHFAVAFAMTGTIDSMQFMPDDVRSRFAPVAANYTRTSFHASTERLQEVLDLARPKPGGLAVEVATGTGNTALALAPYVRRVIGLDLTREMRDE